MRVLASVFALWTLPALMPMTLVLPAAAADRSPRTLTTLQIAQLPRYTASGLHQCGNGSGGQRSCVVSGLFSDCNEAAISLRTRDCCPTAKGGGKSTGFAITYCIPDYSGR